MPPVNSPVPHEHFPRQLLDHALHLQAQQRHAHGGTRPVALTPVIKFTTLFGLLAVSLAVQLTNEMGSNVSHLLAAGFFLVSAFFVYRSFYGMRIGSEH
jgi:hypothetical protein